MPDNAHREVEMAALRAEIEELKEALTSRAEIEQAIGVVVAYGALLPDAAFEVLKEITQCLDAKPDEVAAQLVQWPRSGRLPAETRTALDDALRRGKTPRSPAPPVPEDGA